MACLVNGLFMKLGDTTLQEVSVSVVRDGEFVHEEVVSTAGIGKKNGCR